MLSLLWAAHQLMTTPSSLSGDEAGEVAINRYRRRCLAELLYSGIRSANNFRGKTHQSSNIPANCSSVVIIALIARADAQHQQDLASALHPPPWGGRPNRPGDAAL